MTLKERLENSIRRAGKEATDKSLCLDLSVGDARKVLALLAAAEKARQALAGVTTRLCLTDPGDKVRLGGQGPPWTLWTYAESLEDVIAPVDAALRDMEK